MATAATTRRARTPSRSGRRRSLGRLGTGFAFLLPTLAFLGYFVYYPAYVALAGSFTDWDGFNPAHFVGLDNFEEMLHDTILGTAARNNLLWAIGKVALAIVPPFVVAELIFSVRSRRGRYAYRSLFVVPVVVPLIVTILIWTFFYRSDGLVNDLLGAIGLGGLRHTWLGDSDTALGALIFMGLPWIVPFNLLIFYAGLQGIPQDVREAAELDGARGLTRVLRIDVPLIFTQINLLVALALVASVQAILEPLIMTDGGPGNATVTPIFYLYRQGIQDGRFGYSMAISLILFIVVLIVSILSSRLLRARHR